VRCTHWSVDLECAVNTPLRGGSEGVRLMSTKDKDSREHSREACVVLNPTEEHRFNFKKLDPNSYLNSTVDTVGKGVGRCRL
jgi:hypothetical protein